MRTDPVTAQGDRPFGVQFVGRWGAEGEGHPEDEGVFGDRGEHERSDEGAGDPPEHATDRDP